MREKLANKKNRDRSPGEKFYTREVAAQYEKLRQNDRYWAWENSVLNHCLNTFKITEKIADCPVGTGRFMDVYERHGLKLLGIDISPDMLSEAAKKIEAAGMRGRAELIQADVSTLALDYPVAKALVCFRLVHLISRKSLGEVIRGLVKIPSEYIFLQAFTVKDFNYRRVARRTASAIGSEEINFINKLKYVYRTFRALIAGLLGSERASSKSQHEENTFCDVTYTHSLPRILDLFSQHGFTMQYSYELRDEAHLNSESGCNISTIMVLHKAPAVGT